MGNNNSSVPSDDPMRKLGRGIERVIDSTPVVGHIKGGVHYAMGDKKQGDESMKAAGRTTGAVLGSVGGLVIGGPVGAVRAVADVFGGDARAATAEDVEMNLVSVSGQPIKREHYSGHNHRANPWYPNHAKAGHGRGRPPRYEECMFETHAHQHNPNFSNNGAHQTFDHHQNHLGGAGTQVDTRGGYYKDPELIDLVDQDDFC